MDNRNLQRNIPASPPSDFKGQKRMWVLALRHLKYWNGFNPAFFEDVLLTLSEWQDVLDLAEREDFIKSNL